MTDEDESNPDRVEGGARAGGGPGGGGEGGGAAGSEGVETAADRRPEAGAVQLFLERSDAALIAVVMLGIYLLYIGFAVALGLPLNGTVNTLQRITFLTAVYGMAVLALNLHWGYTGLFNIGVAGFMMTGVYVYGMLTGSPAATGTTGAPGLGLPLWVGFVGGTIAAAIVGGIAALPALRLRADYLAIVTIAFAEIIRITFNATTFQTFTVFGVQVGTGGGSGLSFPGPNEPLVHLLEDQFPVIIQTFTVKGIQPTVVIGWAYTIVLILVLAGLYWLMLRTGNSPFGRVLKAVREDELVAKSLGKDTNLFKAKAFMVGSAMMGLVGILWFGRPGFTNPTTYLPIQTFYIFIALIIGGAGSNTGSVLGGAIFASLLFEGPVFVRRIIEAVFPVGEAPSTVLAALADPGAFVAYTLANVSTLRPILLGVVLIYLMQNRPDGLLGYRKEIASPVNLSERRGSSGVEPPVATDGGDSE